jgi:cell wall-associated NlpC family hydrolase
MERRRGIPLLLATLIGSLTLTILSAPAHADPQNPTDGQIGAAQRSKAQRAKDVGSLKAQIAQAAGQMQRLNDSAELAGERYNKAVADYQTAAHKSAVAQTKVRSAQKQVTAARGAVGKFAHDSYIYGSTMGPSLSLLDASGPTDFIERAGLLQAAGERRTGALSSFQVASVKKANADSAARAAVQAMAKAKSKAAGAQRAAEAKVTAARQQMTVLNARKTTLEGQLVEAQARLSGLVSARAAYLKWKHEQAVLAARRAAKLAQERREAAIRAAKLREQQQELARQQQQQQQQSPPGTDPVGFDPSPPPPSPPPSGGGWSAAKGAAVVQIAEHWLGTPYAWSGGTASGPSYGTSPDEGVFGFDCSGLALYSWAQEGISLPHFSGYQYQLGSHPSMSNLMPGDLLFWSYDGTPSSIHHVAIYIGNNQVIEAPQSGDVVKIVPVWYDGLVGATRPGT